MKFRTEVAVKQEFTLEPDDHIMAFGSCFADRVGALFCDQGVNALINPFGVIYNPVSLAENFLCSLSAGGDQGKWEENNGQFVNLMYHGSMNAGTEAEGLRKVKNIHSQVGNSFPTVSLLIFTWGSAFAYEEVSTGKVVTNCHKFPAERFERKLLSTDQIVSYWEKLLDRCFAGNPGIKIVLTVSPVRHIRDSLIKNQLSKSVLHTALHQLLEKYENLFYFPSYEIMMDDLRDYRFYEENMVQPNLQAVQYIMEKFKDFCFSESMQKYWDEASSIQKLLNHRIMAAGAGGERFLREREKKVNDFIKKYRFSTLGKVQ